MSLAFSPLSESRLKLAHPRLAAVARQALAYDVLDFTIIQTARTIQQEKLSLAAGKSQILNSKHIPGKDGYAHAMDAAPLPIDWDYIDAFRQLNVLMQRAAAELKTKIIWGGDWKTLKDFDHWELA